MWTSRTVYGTIENGGFGYNYKILAWQKIKSYEEDQMDDDWHEGKPEEKGQYLVYCDDKTGADVDYFLDGEWQFHKDHVKAWKNIYVPLWLLED